MNLKEQLNEWKEKIKEFDIFLENELMRINSSDYNGDDKHKYDYLKSNNPIQVFEYVFSVNDHHSEYRDEVSILLDFKKKTMSLKKKTRTSRHVEPYCFNIEFSGFSSGFYYLEGMIHKINWDRNSWIDCDYNKLPNDFDYYISITYENGEKTQFQRINKDGKTKLHPEFIEYLNYAFRIFYFENYRDFFDCNI